MKGEGREGGDGRADERTRLGGQLWKMEALPTHPNGMRFAVFDENGTSRSSSWL